MLDLVARWETDSRYYELHEGEDLFGARVLLQVWGGKGSPRGGMRTVADSPEAIERLKQEVAKRRRWHGYRAMGPALADEAAGGAR